jgi:hypothetical protein
MADPDLRTLAAEAPDTGTQYAGLTDMERAAASADFHMRTCDTPTIADCQQCQQRLDRIQAYLAAVLPAHRAQVLDDAARAISANVRNDDWTKQDRGGFYGVAPKMAYVAGHDKAADIVQRLAATGPTTTPAPRGQCTCADEAR